MKRIKNMTGMLMLVLLFATLFVAAVVQDGWIIALSVFGLAFFLTGFIVLAVFLLTSE